jgi:hypothetical protein
MTKKNPNQTFRLSDAERAKLKRLYLSGRTQAQCARAVGCSQQGASAALKAMGVKTRNGIEAMAKARARSR